MADLPGDASGLLVRDYKGTKADRVVTRIDPGAVSLVAELRAHERQAVEELGHWKTHHEVRKVIDAAPAAITLAMLLADEELDSLEERAGDGEIAGRGRTRWIRCRKPSSGGVPWCACPGAPMLRRASGGRGWMAAGVGSAPGKRRRRFATEPQQRRD